jgi:alanine racemase
MIEPNAWAEVDLDALGENLALVRGKLAAGVRVMGVVKADAYGHGARAVSQELVERGVEYLGVATIDEGIELREAGIEVPVVVLPGICDSACAEAVRRDLSPALYSLPQAGSFSRTAEKIGRALKVHIKIDTGMSRIGVFPDKACEFIESIKRLPFLELEGVFTHFSMVGPGERKETLRQNDSFLRAVSTMKNLCLLHTANSSATLLHPPTHHKMVRPGLALYGCYPWDGCREKIKPVLSLKARIIQIKTIPAGARVSYGGTFTARRPSRIATFPIGYADGYPRLLSNRGWALVHSKKAPVAGRVCMDMTMVDVTDIPEAKEGDEAVLIGKSGGEEIRTEKIARWAETISYEILTGIGRRIPRLYKKSGKT